ncbi:MAG: electron transport complex subunit RsxC [Kiritimatiellaeota bacterium]|nr:electron transport complex subunit RsxC [Kiritimatiellota bacterium]
MPDLHRFHGGVHPREGKSSTSGNAIQTAPLFEKYIVPLQQHIGAPSKVTVAKKDRVLRGQLLAEPGGFVSAAIHAPTSGVVSAVGDCLGPAGTKVPAVEITADGDDIAAEPLAPIAAWESTSPEDLKNRIAEAGIVGMGGAAFPTHVKLSPPPNKPIDVLILNGVECEPCLTADHRLMLEAPDRILTGARILARVLGVSQVYIGIEDNKPDAIELLTRKTEGTTITVASLSVRYPQGAEKQLIYALTGRKVPTGGLPMDVGCVVQNVGTAAAVAEAVTEGKPLYERVTTVTGAPLVRPGNWRLRVGTPLRTVLELCGGVKYDPAKIVFGGPMMGLSVYSLDIPVHKSTSGLLLLGPAEVAQFTSQPCIRCGRCVDACPMNLLPGTLSVEIENERFDLAEEDHAFDCIECGCCAYVCPSHRPLVQHLRRAKSEILAKRRAASRRS